MNWSRSHGQFTPPLHHRAHTSSSARRSGGDGTPRYAQGKCLALGYPQVLVHLARIHPRGTGARTLGAVSPKPTGLLLLNLPRRQGFFVASSLPTAKAIGRNEDGSWRTPQLKEYPPGPMCRLGRGVFWCSQSTRDWLFADCGLRLQKAGAETHDFSIWSQYRPWFCRTQLSFFTCLPNSNLRLCNGCSASYRLPRAKHIYVWCIF